MRREIMKKLLLFVFVFCLFASTTVLATEEDKQLNKDEISFETESTIYTDIREKYSKMIDMSTDEISSEMKKMSINELNIIIDEVYKQSINIKSDSLNTYDMSTRVIYNPIQIAWIAAAEIAIRLGYDCAGTLIKYSVRGDDFSQGVSGNFVSKIKNSSEYKAYMQLPNPPGSFAFTKGDLFYALHNVKINPYLGYPYYTSYISDVFDFELDNNMGDIFTTTVNNWAWLCQQTHVLHKINVNIYFW